MTFFTEANPLRKALLALGGLAFLAGVALITIAAISSLGSGGGEPDIELRDLGASPIVTADATPTPAPNTVTPTPEPTPVPTPPLAEGAYAMVIDKLGVNAPVYTYGLDANAVPEVPIGPDAADIVAWYNFSAEPGTGSNAVFAGHVTWNGPGVFISLTSMAEGDEIKLIGQDGAELTYVVSDVFQVDANDPDSLSVMHRTEEDVITLITCDGDFVDTGDPIFGGEYPYRLVVRAARADSAAALSAGS